MKYYVIEIYHKVPGDLGGVDTIGIYKRPACGKDGRDVIDGWAGALGDWTTCRRGAYDTIDGARAKIDELHPERRRLEEYDDYWGIIVELYRPGKYAQLTLGETSGRMLGARRLTGNETDGQLREILEAAEARANADGCTLHHLAFDILDREREWAQ